MHKKHKKKWLNKTKRSTADLYFDAVKRGDKLGMEKYAKQDSYEQKKGFSL